MEDSLEQNPPGDIITVGNHMQLSKNKIGDMITITTGSSIFPMNFVRRKSFHTKCTDCDWVEIASKWEAKYNQVGMLNFEWIPTAKLLCCAEQK